MPLIGIHGGYTKWSDGKAEAEGLYFVTISVRPTRLTERWAARSLQCKSLQHMSE